MPFVPLYEGEIPSLGWGAIEWAETYLRAPDGDLEGMPFQFTDSQVEFFVRLFRVQALYGQTLFYRRAARIGSKGTGKSPTGAILAMMGIGAPIVPDGFDVNGRPVGRPKPSPNVQIAGVSEDQAGNVYELLEKMVGAGGPLFDALPSLDVGKTRIMLEGRPVIRPVSSNGGTRQGQRVTLAVMEETQEWKRSNGGHKLAAVLRGNTLKDPLGGLAVELSNAPEPGEDSIAERTIVGYRHSEEGRAGILLDMVQPSKEYDCNIPEQRRAHIYEVYGDTAKEKGGWVDVPTIIAGTYDPSFDDSYCKRMFGNIMAAGQGAWLEDPQSWVDLGNPARVRAGMAPITPAMGDMICIGFDGSRTGDSTALRGITIHGGHLFTIGLWERPFGMDPKAYWEVPQEEVQAKVHWAMTHFRVIRAYFDPPHWRDEVSAWAGEWPDVVFEWATNRDTAMAGALERLHTAIDFKLITHDGGTAEALHYGNAYRRIKGSADKPLTLVKKESPTSSRKIDVVVTDALALEARADAIADGLPDDLPEDYFTAQEA